MTNKKSPPASTKGLVKNSKSLNYTSSLANTQQISALLADRLDSLILALLPDKPIYKSGYETRIGSNGSIIITYTPDGAIYFDHEQQQGGNVFALIQHTLSCDFKSALAWAKSFLGLSEHKPWPVPKLLIQKPVVDNSKKIADVMLIWNYTTQICHTYAEKYLRKRGITIDLPDCLRCNHYLWNFTANAEYPALVAPVHDVNGKITGIHTVSIDPFTGNKINGDGIKAKLSKGSIKGGAVRLSHDDSHVFICEGLEDGLSILQLNPSLCVWVGLGGNIRNVEFPQEVTKVTIAADNDTAGIANADKLYHRLRSEGVNVSIIFPPTGFKDFNAYLMGVK